MTAAQTTPWKCEHGKCGDLADAWVRVQGKARRLCPTHIRTATREVGVLEVEVLWSADLDHPPETPCATPTLDPAPPAAPSPHSTSTAPPAPTASATTATASSADASGSPLTIPTPTPSTSPTTTATAGELQEPPAAASTACIVQDCDGRPQGRGLCMRHYSRAYRVLGTAGLSDSLTPEDLVALATMPPRARGARYVLDTCDDGEAGLVVVDRQAGAPLGDEDGEVVYYRVADAIAARDYAEQHGALPPADIQDVREHTTWGGPPAHAVEVGPVRVTWSELERVEILLGLAPGERAEEEVLDHLKHVLEEGRAAGAALDEARVALDSMPCTVAPDCDDDVARRIRYATRTWLSEREEARRRAGTLQGVLDVLDETDAPRHGTPASRLWVLVRQLRVAQGRLQAAETLLGLVERELPDPVIGELGLIHRLRGALQRAGSRSAGEGDPPLMTARERQAALLLVRGIRAHAYPPASMFVALEALLGVQGG